MFLLLKFLLIEKLVFYVYNPDLSLQNNGKPYKNDIWGIGEADTSSYSLADMCIAKDGRLFFTANDYDLYNIYSITLLCYIYLIIY